MMSINIQIQFQFPIKFSFKPQLKGPRNRIQFQYRPPPTPTTIPAQFDDDDDDDVKTLANFTSSYNHICVLEVSRRAIDHPFAGSRLLLLDSPGNIHSISFLFSFTFFTCAYLDVFATLLLILPSQMGPIALLGFRAGSAARLILHLYPQTLIHAWELNPSVITVAREFFNLEELKKRYPKKLLFHIGDAFSAADGGNEEEFSGIVVDLFSKGRLVPELQIEET